jgi:hypothetical protein
MTQCREAIKSPRRNSDGSWDRTFWVSEVSDAAQALGVAAGVASTTYLGCTRDDEPEMQPLGYAIWEVSYHYSKPTTTGSEATQPDDPTSEDADDLDAVLEFDTTGGTAHITQCISQTDYGAESGAQIKDSLCIGVTGDSVEGTDIVVPKLILSLTRRPPVVSGEYVKRLSRLTGKTCQGPYVIRGQVLGVYCEVFFDDGELMFLGATPTGKTLGTDGRFIYRYEASENRAEAFSVGKGLDGGDINVASKKGHDYLWMRFANKELTTPVAKVPVPHIAFVSKLQESRQFGLVLGF